MLDVLDKQAWVEPCQFHCILAVKHLKSKFVSAAIFNAVSGLKAELGHKLGLRNRVRCLC